MRGTKMNAGILIREAVADDAASLREIYAPIVENTPISFEIVSPSVEEMARRIEDTSRIYPYLVAQRNGQVIGYAYASQHRSRAAYASSVGVSAYVAEQERRSGTGR